MSTICSRLSRRKLRLCFLLVALAALCYSPRWAFGQTNNPNIASGGTDLVSLDQNATIASLALGGTKGSSTLQNLSGTAETHEVIVGTTINSTRNLTFGNASILKLEA